MSIRDARLPIFICDSETQCRLLSDKPKLISLTTLVTVHLVVDHDLDTLKEASMQSSFIYVNLAQVNFGDLTLVNFGDLTQVNFGDLTRVNFGDLTQVKHRC